MFPVEEIEWRTCKEEGALALTALASAVSSIREADPLVRHNCTTVDLHRSATADLLQRFVFCRSTMVLLAGGFVHLISDSNDDFQKLDTTDGCCLMSMLAIWA